MRAYDMTNPRVAGWRERTRNFGVPRFSAFFLFFHFPVPLPRRWPRSASDDKARILQAFSDKYTPGRFPHIKPPSESEMRGTGVVRIPIVEVSAKVRTGPPKDDAEDYDNASYWAGVIPVRMYSLPAIPDDRLLPGVPVPPHVAQYAFVPQVPTARKRCVLLCCYCLRVAIELAPCV